MSRIVAIEVHAHCNDLGGRIWNPAIRWIKKFAVFVVVVDDRGNRGLGECWCFDTSPAVLVTFLRHEVIPEFLGCDLAELEGVSARLTNKATLSARHGILASALSGVDIAVWDLRAQHRDSPLWQLLDADGPGSVYLYASGGLYGKDKDNSVLTEEMAGFASTGFRLSKMKVGGETMEQDIARVHAVLAALPEDANLIVDGVYSYTADAAQRLFEALPEGRITAFQSPLKARDITGMKRLGRAGIPVMATEAEYREELHIQLVHEAEIAFLQTAPVACGGITRVKSLCDLTRVTSTEISLEISSTAIALMAAVQLAAAWREIAHVEFHTVHQVFFDQLRLGPMDEATRRTVLQDAPGIGISLVPGKTTIEAVERSASVQQDLRQAAT